MSGKEIPDSDRESTFQRGMWRVGMFLRGREPAGNQSLPRTRFVRNIAGLSLTGAKDGLDELFGDGGRDLGIRAAALFAKLYAGTEALKEFAAWGTDLEMEVEEELLVTGEGAFFVLGDEGDEVFTSHA
jgi:hypothetical protein